MAVLLEFYRLCFRLLAKERISFPAGKAGNVLRGAFGSILRKQTCRPQCSGAGTCAFGRACAYAVIFEPRASGRFWDQPRPFVFRADHLDGQTIEAGQSFEFGMNLFDLSAASREHVVEAFSELNTLGAYRSPTKCLDIQTHATRFDLAPGADAVNRIQVTFRTPTELKTRNELAGRPEFPILYARASERVKEFCRAPAEFVSCPNVQMVGCSLVDSHVERRSSKTGQRHRLGGFIGSATYKGDLRECLPILKAAEFTGVGRHTSWGNGRIEIALLD